MSSHFWPIKLLLMAFYVYFHAKHLMHYHHLNWQASCSVTATSGGKKQLRHSLGGHFLGPTDIGVFVHWPARLSSARPSLVLFVFDHRFDKLKMCSMSFWSTNSRNVLRFNIFIPAEFSPERSCWGLMTARPETVKLDSGRQEVFTIKAVKERTRVVLKSELIMSWINHEICRCVQNSRLNLMNLVLSLSITWPK